METQEADRKAAEAVMLVSKYDATQADADRAVSIFERLIAQGHSGSMFGMADLKMSGRWVPRDVDGALDLYTKAAELGNVPAMFRLGGFYAEDEGHFDPGKAFDYLSRSADAGFPPAFGGLGDLYFYGIGTEKDPVKAADSYMRAAGKGDGVSMFKLGCMYKAGMGVEVDKDRSAAMFLGAAKSGIAEAQFEIGSLIYDGEFPGTKAEAAEWYTLCADHVPVAKFNLATMYFQGDGVERDLKRSFGLFRELADAGDSDAMVQVGKMYLGGEGVDQNAEEGFRYVGLAAKSGNEEAAMLVESLRRRQNSQLITIDGTEDGGENR